MEKEQKKGYQFNDQKIDDNKLYARSERSLLLDLVEEFTSDIDQCKTLHIKRGKQQYIKGYGQVLLAGEIIDQLKNNKD